MANLQTFMSCTQVTNRDKRDGGRGRKVVEGEEGGGKAYEVIVWQRNLAAFTYPFPRQSITQAIHIHNYRKRSQMGRIQLHQLLLAFVARQR